MTNPVPPASAEASQLEMIKALAEKVGFHFEVDQDGTERCYRPDGTVAVIARKTKNVNRKPSAKKENQ